MYTYKQIHVEAELSPGSIEEWLSIIQQGKKIDKGTKRCDLSIKVKKHLSALGWIFWFASKGKRRESRYQSPNGKWFYSLATACMSFVDQNIKQEEEIVPKSVISCSPRKLDVPNLKRTRFKEKLDASNKQQKKKMKNCETAAFEGEASLNSMSSVDQHKSVATCSPTKLDVLNLKRARFKEKPDVSNKQQKKKKNCETAAFKGEASLNSMSSVDQHKSVVTCSPSKLDVLNLKRTGFQENLDVSNKRKKKKDCDTAAFKREASSTCMSCVDPQEQQIVPKSAPCSPRKLDVLNKQQNKMDCLQIVLNIKTPKQKQRKRRKKSDDVLASSEGKGEEIKQRTLKSLKKILQVMEKKNEKEEKEYLKFLREDSSPDMNCDVCCVCHYGGDLLLCDGCPSAFHYTCLGLSNLPEEDLWFCPCCCCNICGSMESSSGNSKLISCEQCLNRYHLKCLKEEDPCLVSPRGWFCSKQCNRVFIGLENLIGCKIGLGHDDLVWTLMRAPNDAEHYDNEQLSKLDSAVEILHQGFEPSKDLFSGRDLVEELIFKKDEKGIGRGFYTVLIERKNVAIIAAAIRVNKDVAEIPLVSTLSNYRRSGMCKVLMDELEKQMSRIGVRELILPAAEDDLTTWINRFGFSVMESSKKLELVKHGMLEFVGTVMCQKLLIGSDQDSKSKLDSET